MPTMLDPQKVVALQDRDLATIREEVADACPYLGHALGFPVELLVVDANNAVFMAEEGLVTASYAVTNDDQIVFDDIEFHEGVENPMKLDKAKALVEAIMNDRLAEAEQIWPSFETLHVSDFASRRRLEQLAESVSFDSPEKVGLSTVVSENIQASAGYFRRENFDCLAKLEELRACVMESINDAIDSEEPLGETSYYTARGGRKTPKRVKVDRKKRRLAKKYARKNRAALIRRLKVARRKLKKMFRKPAFRRRLSRVRRLNDAHEVDQIVKLLHETIAEEPNIAYLTIPEISEQVVEALKLEGVKNYTDRFVEEVSMALAIMARNVYPESRRYITDAALAFLPPSYNTPSDDPFESLEHINALLWEKVSQEEAKKEDVIKMTHELLSSLVDTLIDDMESADDEDEEAKEISKVLEKLKGYRDDLAAYDENPEEADLKKVKSVLDYIAGIMDVEEDEDEDEDEDKPKSEDDDEDEGEDESDDDDSDDESDDDGPDDDGSYDDPKVEDDDEEDDEEKPTYDEALAHKLFGGNEESLPKSEAHGEQSDHSVSDDHGRDPLLEGYSMTSSASQALKDLMKALGNDNVPGTAKKTPGLGSNEWLCGKDKCFYELDSRDQPDGGIKGEVMKIGGPGRIKSMGQLHIDGNGYILSFPGAPDSVIAKVNKGKEPRQVSESMKTEGSSNLSVPEQHQKKIALRTLQLSDEGAVVLGGMTKEEARKFLKDKCGYTDKKIAKLEESVLVTEEEEVYVPEKAREAVKRWADSVGAVLQFDKAGKAKIPGQHMQAFKTNFGK